MRIGINLLSIKEMTGVGVYAHTLLTNLGKIDKDKDDVFLIFTNSKLYDEFHFNFPNFYYVKLNVSPDRFLKRIFFEQVILPIQLKKHKIDVLFNPSVFNPFFSSCPKITVLHDIAYLNMKFGAFKKIYFKFVTSAAVKSRAIITISEFSKREILKQLKIKNEKIKIIYESCPPLLPVDSNKISAILNSFGISEPYFFYIGAITPHKNIKNIILAFEDFYKSHRDFKMIFAGPIVEELIDLDNMKKEIKFGEEIKFLGKVSEEEKIVLYSGAKGFVFPSLYEGFGLPVLEAQSLGVPVLTSNIASLPEVSGDGVLYVDPTNVSDIASGMTKLATDEILVRELIKKGFKNIDRFSPEAEAKETLDVIKNF
jgi:glycosyltransferase involved in cell wall biosynthesis